MNTYAIKVKDLDPEIREEIDSLFRSAKEFFQKGEIKLSLSTAAKAWEMVPYPKFGWDVSKSYTHAYAILYRDTGNYKKALDIMKSLFASGTVKPYQDRPYFILGTIYYEMGDTENAKKLFQEANKISKGRCFTDEPSKYLKLISN